MKSKFTGRKLLGCQNILTERHLDILTECHRRQVLKKEPLSVTSVGQVQRLSKAELIDTEWYTQLATGKNIMVLKLTPLGIDVVENPTKYMKKGQ